MGISALIASVVDAVSTVGTFVATTATGIAEAVGVPAAIAGPIGAGVETGLGQAALGAGEAAITGGDPAKGAEAGAISGFVGGAGGGLLGEAVPGLGPTAAGALANAAGGALGAAATGGSPVRGAITGAATSLAAGALRGAGAGGGAGGAGGAAAAPSTGAPTDPGAPTDTSVGSGDLSAPTASTLPGTVGAGAAAPGGSTQVSGLTVPALATSASGLQQIPEATASLPSAQVSGLAPIGPLAPGADSLNITPASSGGGAGGGVASLLKNPAALMFGADLLAGNRAPPHSKQLSTEAGQLTAEGAQMRGYLNSGMLPPGLESELTAATEAAKAGTRGFYSSIGQSGSSAEYRDVGDIALRESAQAGQIATQLFQAGLSETQIGAQLYSDLMQVQLQQDQNLSDGISGFVKSLAAFSQPVAPTAA